MYALQVSMDPISLSKLLCLIIMQNEQQSKRNSWSVSATLQIGSLHLLNKVLQEHGTQQFLEATPGKACTDYQLMYSLT